MSKTLKELVTNFPTIIATSVDNEPNIAVAADVDLVADDKILWALIKCDCSVF